AYIKIIFGNPYLTMLSFILLHHFTVFLILTSPDREIKIKQM
ncbi:unnamed protein product, partial [marine sediment metagenome]